MAFRQSLEMTLSNCTRAQQWKPFAQLVLRPLLGGYPDEGRTIVQAPGLRRLLNRITSVHRVLNAGAGEGLFSALLLKMPGVARVLEIDYSYCSYRRPATDPRQFMVGASLAAIPTTSHTFDLVLCTEVLEHIVDDRAALDELRRVLAPGGWLLITVPTPPAVYDPNHVREGYTAELLTEMLNARGLEIVETEFCMYGAFKLIMRIWRHYGRMPRATIWCLAFFDRLWPIGRPMDLMILSRLPVNTSAAVENRTRKSAGWSS
jgi:SAM-dependent methyltransferase